MLRRPSGAELCRSLHFLRRWGKLFLFGGRTAFRRAAHRCSPGQPAAKGVLFVTHLSDLAQLRIGSFTLGHLCSALVLLLICLLVIRFLCRMLTRLLSASSLDSRIRKYLLRGAKGLMYLITVLIVIDRLGVPVTSLVALLSVCSLGVTLAAEDILGNLAGGFILLSAHAFSVGDFIEVGDVSGTVEDISLHHTRLISMDGLTVMIPNKTLASSQVVNCTVLGRRRVCWKVSASYDAPTASVKAAGLEAVRRAGPVLEDPAPVVRLCAYGESAIDYAVYCWVKPEDYWPVYFALGEALRDTFAQHGIEMTYNHLNVHIVENRASVGH